VKYSLISLALLSCTHIVPLKTKIEPVSTSHVSVPQKAPASAVITQEKQVENVLPDAAIFENDEEASNEAAITRVQDIIQEQANEAVSDLENSSKITEDDLNKIEEAANVDPSQIAQEPLPESIKKEQASLKFNFHSSYEKKSKWLNYFAKKENKERLERFFNNGERFRTYIEEVFEENEIPKDLYFVGLIESGYQLKATSSAKAVGPWQFMKSTAKEYGLKVFSSVDERRDIFKATKSAALYFKDLYNIFGSWELALSGYNAGPYRIINLITRENTRDFSILSKSKYFPSETSDYVPKLQAVMEIYDNAKGFGINIREDNIDPFNNTTLIPLKYSVSLNTISKKLSISKEKLKKLNPELTGNYTPFYKKSSYQIRIPENSYDEILAADLRNLKERAIASTQTTTSSSVATHKVKKGENLYFIAGLYHTSLKSIMKLNKFKNSKIYVGQKLRVPKRKRTYYTVRRGDNLSTISSKFGRKISSIAKLNNLKKNMIYPGQKLIIK